MTGLIRQTCYEDMRGQASVTIACVNLTCTISGAIWKEFQKALISFVTSVCLSVRKYRDCLSDY